MVYGALNLHIVLDYFQHRTASQQEEGQASYQSRVIGSEAGETIPIPVEEVLWFEVDHRKYYAVLKDRRVRITETLKALEAVLDPDCFVRINKSQILAVAHVARFAPWVDGKYTVGVHGRPRTRLTISRTRASDFKARLAT